MHVTIIANGFQEDYITNLLNNLAGKIERIDFVGSDMHQIRVLDKRIVFYNLRGDHKENVSLITKVIRNITYYIKLADYLLKSRSTLVHVQYFRLKILEGIAFTLFIRMLGKKAVYTAHDVLPHSRDNAWNRIIYRIIYSLQHLIIAHTHFIRNRIINEFGINTAKIVCTRHGVYQREVHEDITREAARERLALPNDATVFLFFGIIAAYKGPDILLQSILFLPEPKDIHVLFAGKLSAEYRQEFESMMAAFPSENITKHLQYIKDEDIEYYFKAADATVLPYKEASQSGVLFMSYTYGIPVIVPDIGEFPEDIIPGQTGYVFKANDPHDLADTLLRFMAENKNSESLNKEFIQNFARINYSWEDSCNELVHAYKTCFKIL
jgi:glycosyltransferase involved in cell wall biosynthesis